MTDASIRGTVDERAHAHAIAVHCPGLDEMSMAVRVELATMRDAAMVGVNRACESASIMLGEVARLAGAAVFSAAPCSELLRLKAALTIAMMAAREIEQVQRNG